MVVVMVARTFCKTKRGGSLFLVPFTPSSAPLFSFALHSFLPYLTFPIYVSYLVLSCLAQPRLCFLVYNYRVNKRKVLCPQPYSSPIAKSACKYVTKEHLCSLISQCKHDHFSLLLMVVWKLYIQLCRSRTHIHCFPFECIFIVCENEVILQCRKPT